MRGAGKGGHSVAGLVSEIACISQEGESWSLQVQALHSFGARCRGGGEESMVRGAGSGNRHDGAEAGQLTAWVLIAFGRADGRCVAFGTPE